VNDKEKRNQAEALANKHCFEITNDLKQRDHFQFIGGFLKYHQWVTLTLATVFVSLGLLHQKGSFLYFYLFGFYKISKDTVKTYSSLERLKLGPIIYYTIGGLICLIVLTENGYPIPDMSLGFIQNIYEVIG